ncbi:MAG: hypothetical protein ACI814_001638, partial [Mariniblastus sp.]
MSAGLRSFQEIVAIATVKRFLNCDRGGESVILQGITILNRRVRTHLRPTLLSSIWKGKRSRWQN